MDLSRNASLKSLIWHLQSQRHESLLNPVTSRCKKSLEKFYVLSVALRSSVGDERSTLLPPKQASASEAPVEVNIGLNHSKARVHTSSVLGTTVEYSRVVRMIPVKSGASQNILPCPFKCVSKIYC